MKRIQTENSLGGEHMMSGWAGHTHQGHPTLYISSVDEAVSAGNDKNDAEPQDTERGVSGQKRQRRAVRRGGAASIPRISEAASIQFPIVSTRRQQFPLRLETLEKYGVWKNFL